MSHKLPSSSYSKEGSNDVKERVKENDMLEELHDLSLCWAVTEANLYT